MRDLVRQVCDLVIAIDHYRQAVAGAINAGTHEVTTLIQLVLCGPLTPTAIAENLGMTTASVTGLLDRMAAAGYVERSPNPLDRRSILVHLTEKGSVTGNAIFELLTDDVAAPWGDIDESERAAVADLVDRLAAALRRRSTEPGLPGRLGITRRTPPPVPPREENSAT